jgi:hypothetical protein
MGLLENLLRGRRRPRPPSVQTVVSRKIGKAIGALIIAGGAALFGLNMKGNKKANVVDQNKTAAVSDVAKTDANFQILKAISDNKEISFVEAKNVKVVKLLRADNKGARHQRWVVQFDNGTQMTAVYNIDLADKVPLSVGDVISMGGELVFGDRKGDPILHWIHADPRKKRIDGYVMLNDKKYGQLSR